MGRNIKENLKLKHLRCLYKTGKCNGIRAIKRNGDYHTLCIYHRNKQNEQQRRSDRKHKNIQINRRKIDISLKKDVEDSLETWSLLKYLKETNVSDTELIFNDIEPEKNETENIKSHLSMSIPTDYYIHNNYDQNNYTMLKSMDFTKESQPSMEILNDKNRIDLDNTLLERNVLRYRWISSTSGILTETTFQNGYFEKVYDVRGEM